MFKPQYILIEKEALKYEKGRLLKKYFQDEGFLITLLKSNRVTGLPTKDALQRYHRSKKTLVVSVRKSLKFQTCKPSAHYQLPLVTGCMGGCEYCYLQTRFSKQPYTRIYVNTDEILSQAQKYINERDDITIFEGAAVSDPIPVEPYTNALASSINYFGKEPKARFTFVTKYPDIDSLLRLEHNQHTTIRFSINLDGIIKQFEHRTPSLGHRLAAAKKVLDSDYHLGFIIAPVILGDKWQKKYTDLLNDIYKEFGGSQKMIVFEVISHRFTTKAKETILSVYPNSKLPMAEEDRKFKFGQFGYGKYVYPKEEFSIMKKFFTENIQKMSNKWSIKYII